jgi:galactonate dehydratase
MRSRDVTRVVDAGDRDWVFVRVETDEPGLVGWGESSLGWQTNAVRGAVRDLEPLLVGRDPRPIERHWQTMTRGLYFKGGIATTSAVSGIDQALWDIKAKALGVPVYELLGGPVGPGPDVREPRPSSAARGRPGLADAAVAAREAGFDAMKAYPMAPARPLEGTAALEKTVELVAAVRDAAGDDADVMVDLHGRTSPAMARVGRALGPSVLFLESRASRARGRDGRWRELTDHGRTARHAQRFMTLEERACAVIQPNACYCGGVSEVRRIAAMAEASLVTVAPHNPNGPIGTMVSIHLALVLPNFLILEQVRGDVPWRLEIVDEPFETVDGYVDPPTRPGIGVELVEEVAVAHPGRSPRPHLVSAPDGSLLDW